MNAKQLNFAYKVRHALNENLDSLPASTTERLANARKLALLAKKKEAPQRRFVTRERFAWLTAGHLGNPFAAITRFGLIMPAIVLVIGLITIFQVEQQQRIRDLAEIDALVLSDELPLSAYLDHGFSAYVANRGE